MYRMKRFIILLLVCFFMNIGAIGSISAQNSIKWQPYTSGMDLAKSDNKAVFLHFYTNWCVYCAKMEKESFQDGSIVEYLNENFISIRIDLDKEQNIAQKYSVFGVPITYFISSSGDNLGSVPGYISKDRLMDILKKVQSI